MELQFHSTNSTLARGEAQVTVPARRTTTIGP